MTGYGYRMGLDDENEGFGPGECLEHEWWFHSAQLVTREGWEFPDGTPGIGMSQVEECKWCGALQYLPSLFDTELSPKERRKNREQG